MARDASMFARPGANAIVQSRAHAGSSDAELVARVARGDTRAFEDLYRGYFPRLARFIERTTRR